jgi:nicotinamidase-related amidase
MSNDKYIEPDAKHCALIVIDVQKDFALKGAPAEISGTLQAVPNIQRILNHHRKLKLPIIHVIRLYQMDGSNVDLCRKKTIENGKQMVIVGSNGAELVDELKPSPEIKLNSNLLLSGSFQKVGEREWIMYKPRWSAFYNTSLEKNLRNLDVNTIVVCGCNFPNCPRTTIYEASERDFKIVMIKDATSLLYDKAILELKNIGISIKDTDEYIAWIDRYRLL